MTQPYPPHPAPARRRSPLPWLLALVGVLVLLCCGGATAVVLYYADYEGPPARVRPSPRAQAPDGPATSPPVVDAA